METYFRAWKPTLSEADLAGFAFKGASVTEIAHLNTVDRKAGVSGRCELLT